VQLLAHLAGLAINIGGNVLLIPNWGVEGAAVATLLSLWAVNGIGLVLMGRLLGLNCFDRVYVQAFSFLFGGATVAVILLRFSGVIPDVIMLPVFLLFYLVLMAQLYRSGHLVDKKDRDLIQSIFKRKQIGQINEEKI